jgi:alkylation response protein AidB-like acyl-CoA dehydrogenase
MQVVMEVTTRSWLCSAKAEVAECAVEVVNEAMTLLGGKGYAAESLVHRLLRDARAAHVMAPTTDLLRTWTGRALLDVPLLRTERDDRNDSHPVCHS